MREPARLEESPQRLFTLQKQNRWKVAAKTAAERVATLRKLKAAILARREAIKEAINADFRKHQAESELTELMTVLVELDDAIKHTAKWMKPRKVGTPLVLFGTRSEIRYEPKGVVLIMAPWNYPFSLLINPLIAAIAAGNCALLKPSEKTPHTARILHELIDAVFDPSEVALVEGGAEVAEQLLELPFDHIFFTGSIRVGKLVMAAAAKHLSSVTLELGGKSPAIVDTSADLKGTAETIAWGKFVNCGQTCVAPDYVVVPKAQQEALVGNLKATIERFYGKDAEVQRSPDFCRMVDGGAFARLKSLLEDAVALGAKVEVGGITDPQDRFIAPTVLTNVPKDAAIMQEEIFGPILPVLTYDNLDEVLRNIDEGSKPLALYLFAKDNKRIEHVLRNTTSGGTLINNTLLHLANAGLPFGGVGPSGTGNYHGEFGFKAFSHERAVMRQGSRNFAAMYYPPYGTPQSQRALKLLRRLVG